MYHYSYYYTRRSVGIHAMSGIDIALWDIAGKKMGVPVSMLIGGRFREKIPAYCSVLMPETKEDISVETEQVEGTDTKEENVINEGITGTLLLTAKLNAPFLSGLGFI